MELPPSDCSNSISSWDAQISAMALLFPDDFLAARSTDLDGAGRAGGWFLSLGGSGGGGGGTGGIGGSGGSICRGGGGGGMLFICCGIGGGGGGICI
mmetsp:Transcript_6817/g.15564  ORF Transcript_6817/g.15564 Transcript_6817/m.15564 type:complete len:97 (-) Transcript_6817:243-533(-)